MAFWIAATAMTLVALAFVLARLVMPRRGSPFTNPREASLAALRASRAELERDLAVGLISEREHLAARDELAQRAAEELDECQAPGVPRRAWAAALASAVIVPLAAYALYAKVGSPSVIESVQAVRSIGAMHSAQRLPALREALANHLRDHDDDGRAWALLARVSLEMDRFAEAESAFEQAVKNRKVALDPAVWCDYADAAALAQGGRLEGKPALLVGRALALNGAHPRALEMAGSIAIERGDMAGAAHYWQALLAQLPEDLPQHAQLSRAIEKAVRLAAETPRN